MEEVAQCPTLDDVMVIKVAASLFLKTRNVAARNMMSKTIGWILNKYNLTHLSLDKYTVRAVGDKYAVVKGREYLWNEEQKVF